MKAIFVCNQSSYRSKLGTPGVIQRGNDRHESLKSDEECKQVDI